MSVQPNSTIYLLKGCDLDKGYNHTFYWSGTADEIKQKQYEYFISLAKPNFFKTLTNVRERIVCACRCYVIISMTAIILCSKIQIMEQSGFTPLLTKLNILTIIAQK